MLQHMNWRIAAGSQCAVALVRVLTLVPGEARVPRMKRKREKEAKTVRKLEKCKLSGLSGHSSKSKPK